MEDEGRLMGQKGSKNLSIKVGQNEWIVVDREHRDTLSLCTSGLSGCVGVAIATPQRAFLAHISSDVSAENLRNKVKDQFSQAIAKLGNLADVDLCEIVIGDDKETDLSEAMFDTLGELLGAENLEDLQTAISFPYTGMRIYPDGKSFQCDPVRNMNDFKDSWGPYQNSDEAAEHIKAGCQGVFWPKGYVAGTLGED